MYIIVSPPLEVTKYLILKCIINNSHQDVLLTTRDSLVLLTLPQICKLEAIVINYNHQSDINFLKEHLIEVNRTLFG